MAIKRICTARTRSRLESAVRALCPIIVRQISSKSGPPWTEYALRRELVICILGSQVRHDMALAALERIEQAGLLNDSWWSRRKDTFEQQVFNALSSRYRFPKVRAHQLAKARDALSERSLSERLTATSDPKQMRRRLVADISGLGPKQASMFLRNIGESYDLAILDTHVLRFMENVLCCKRTRISTISTYEQTERIVVDYAKDLGYPVGYLDWAIWVTMRAARELGILAQEEGIEQVKGATMERQSGQMLGYAILAPSVVAILERLKGVPDDEQRETLQVAKRLLEKSISAMAIVLQGVVTDKDTPIAEQLHALGTVRKALKYMPITNGVRVELQDVLKRALDSIDNALSGAIGQNVESRQAGIVFFNGLTRALAIENYCVQKEA